MERSDRPTDWERHALPGPATVSATSQRPEVERPARLFLAHARDDRDLVSAVGDALETQGADPWLDTREVPPRAEWEQWIKAALAHVDALVFFISAKALQPGRFCLVELERAVELKLPVIGVLLEPISGEAVRPEGISRESWVDVVGLPHEQIATRVLAAKSLDLAALEIGAMLRRRAQQWRETGSRGSLLSDAELGRIDRQGAGLSRLDLPGSSEEFLKASREHARRQQRRVRILTTAALVVATVLLTIALIALLQARRSRAKADDEAKTARQKAAVAQSLALASIGARQPTDRSYAAIALGYEASLLDDSAEARRTLLTAFQPVGPPVLHGVLHGHSDVVTDAAFSADGRLVATASADGTARIWDAQTGRQLHVLSNPGGSVDAVVFSPSDRFLATAGSPSAVRLWDVRSGRLLKALRAPAEFVNQLAFGAGGATLIATGPDGPGALWETASGRELATLRQPRFFGSSSHVDAAAAEPAWPMAVSPDQRLVATAGENSEARLWDARTGRRIAALTTGAEAASGFAFSPDSRYLAVGGYDHRTRIWELPRHRMVAMLRGEPSAATSLAFSRDGSTLLTAGGDRNAKFWLARSGKEIGRIDGLDGGNVSLVAYSPDGRLVATADADGTARLFELGTDRSVTLSGHGASLTALRFSRDGRRLLTAGYDGTARIWDTGAAFAQMLTGHAAAIRAVTTSPDGRLAVTGSDDGKVGVWDTRTGRRVRWLTGHRGPVVTVAFRPGGLEMLSASQDGTARLWDVPTGRLLAVLRGQHDALTTAAFSPQGSVVVTASDDGTARLWRSADGKPIATLRHGSFVTTVAFSPDGRLVATGASDTAVKLWDARNGRFVAELRGHDGGIDHIAFVPGSRRLVVLGNSGMLRLWDAVSHRSLASARLAGTARTLAVSSDGRVIATGADSGQVELWGARTLRRVATLSGQHLGITALAFSSDGRMLASADGDDSIRLWDAHSGRALDVLPTTREVDAFAISPGGTYLVSGGSEHAGRIWRNVRWRSLDDLQRTVCQVTGGGLTPQEWSKFAPGIAYRNHCRRQRGGPG